MEFVRQAVSQGLEARAVAAIPIRQVLARATVRSPQEFEEWMKILVAEELNVESVKTEQLKDDIDPGVVLDTELTPELRRKGAIREITRHVNSLRKQAGLTLQDRIVLHWESDSEFWQQVFAEYSETIRQDTLADATENSRIDAEQQKEIKIDDQSIWVGIKLS